MSKTDRARHLLAFEQWAETAESGDLVTVDTAALKMVLSLVEQRATVEAQLLTAVRDARARGHSWSQIGLMLGVSKQAAQRKYGPCALTA